VTDKEGLRGEGIWLYVNVGTTDATKERALSDIGIPTDKQGSSVWLNVRQTAKMLPHLVEVDERILKAFADCGHATQRRSFQLFGLEEALSILDESDIIS
jgi:hypothetical protein